MTIATVSLPDDIAERLNGLVQETGKPKDFHILAAIREYLEDMEDIALADRVMAKVRAGTMEVSSAEEVEKRLGLAD